MPVGRRRGDLPGVAAGLVQPRVERHAAGQRGVDGKRAGDDRRGKKVFAQEKSFQRQGRRGLRAVQQRQPFLGREADRLQSGDLQRLRAGNSLPAVGRLALAQQHQCHVCQGGQVAGGPARAFHRHARIDLAIQQPHQRLDDPAPHAGAPQGQAVDLQQQQQTDDAVAHHRADARGMGKHDAPLQKLQFIGRNPPVGQQAEARVDAVDHSALRDDPLDDRRRRVDRRVARRVQRELHRPLPYAAHVRQRELAGLKHKLHHLASSMGRSSRFSRTARTASS